MPHQVHVNKFMKKFFPVILGLFIGIFISGFLIFIEEGKVAYSADEKADDFDYYNDFIASAQSVDFNEIFAQAKGANLYFLIYSKLFIFPEQDSMSSLAQSYGLTETEAQSMLDGNLDLIMEVANGSGTDRNHQMTREEAYNAYTDMAANYDEFKELFELEQEIDSIVTPSEIFSNGDLTDSGFDLVYDLTKIEEILFVETGPVTVGANYSNKVDKPVLSVPGEFTLVDTNSDEGDDETSDESSSENDEEGGSDSYVPDSYETNEDGNPVETVTIAGEEVEIEYLEDDVCDDENTPLSPIEEFNYQEETETTETELGTEINTDIDEDNHDENENSNNTDSGGLSLAESSPTFNPDGTINTPPASEWGNDFCGGGPSDSSKNMGKTLGSEGFSTFGQGADSPLNKALSSSYGESVSFETKGLSANAGFCFKVEKITETVSTYLPGQTCIACEVEKINKFLSETLDHSLMPNKVTGSFMGAAKCSKGFKLLLDFQFVLVPAPIPSPPNDDLIFKNNIYKQWNEMIDNLSTVLGPSVDSIDDFSEKIKFRDELTMDFALASAPDGITNAELLSEINNIENETIAKTQLELATAEISEEVINLNLYSKTLLSKMKEMNAFFESFYKIFNDIDVNACESLLLKECI